MNKKELMEKSGSLFRNRNRLEIIGELLDCARQGAPKMHLIYEAKLSHRLASFYINHLLTQRLIATIQSEDGRRIYKTSERGLKFLEMYEMLNEITFGQLSTNVVGRDLLPIPKPAQVAVIPVSS
jgi:predicted transcriptional regulator